MYYLFGDSTPSKLTTNFLEFLKDAVDFAVFALQSDDRIKRGQGRAIALRNEAEAEGHRLDRFIQVVSGTIERADTGVDDSPTTNCATRLLALVVDTHRSASNGIKQRLAEDIAAIEADEAAARAACVKALETLLLPHDPPDASSVLRVSLADDGSRYGATLAGSAEFGLEWTLGLAIPDGNLWSSPLQVSRVAPQMEIKAPQLSGWISKEVKIKAQRIERHVFTELVDDGRSLKLAMRSEQGNATGFTFEIGLGDEPRVLEAVRVGPADDPANGAFEPAPEDAAALVELAMKLRAAAKDFARRSLLSASSAGADFAAQPSFVDVVERLIDMMAPIVRELAERSLTPNELIMRRPLGNDRREEIFVSKGALIDKYAKLSAPLRALFEPLGLEDVVTAPAPLVASVPPPASAVSAPPPAAVSAPPPPVISVPPPPVISVPPPPVASEPSPPVASAPPPPSKPSGPPPMPSSPPPAVASVPPTSVASAPPPAIASAPPRSGPTSVPPIPPPPAEPTRVVGARLGPLPPARMPPRKLTPTSVTPPSPPAPASDPGEVEVTVEEDEEATPPPVAKPQLQSAFPPPLPNGQARNQELVAELKRIHSLSRNQQFDEAYVGYRELFSDLGFTKYKPEEQRQALRLMIVPKNKPPITDVVLDAHRVALSRIKTLTEVFDDAGDYELLGVAHLALDEVESARSAFTTALGIERRRNPQSELVGTLMKRVSEI